MPSPNSDGLPILLVEGNPSDRTLIARVFRERLMVVADAEAALDAVRRQSFAAILLAHVLPGRSGIDLLRDLRAADPRTPIVLLAENGEEGVVARALRHGADACVVKQAGFERTVPVIVASAVRQCTETPVSAGDALPTAPAEPLAEVLVFELDEQRHALRAVDVEEILPALTVTAMPGAPAGVEGVINLRGRLVPVLDLRQVLRLPSRPITHTDHLIVLRAGARPSAVRVDRAVELVPVAGGSLPGGVAQLPGGLVFVHDPREFLSSEDARALERALARVGDPR
jgi:purine-binding chemotaxis protein CheW